MAAKRIRVSDDAGTTLYTLPGNTGSFHDEAGQLDDTIFGQNFQSSFPGLNGWTLTANALVKGYAGYVATIRKTGTTTVMTGEAMALVSGKTYQITNVAKRLIDRSFAWTVKDNAVNQNANVLSVDYLSGQVTFKSSYTVIGPVTIDGKYLPTVVVGCSNDFTLTQNAKANDNTCMDTAQTNSGNRTFAYGLKTVSLELKGIYRAADAFHTLLLARAELIISIDLEGNGKNLAVGFFRAVTNQQSGDVGNLEEATINFDLSVPDDAYLVYPFHWYISSSSDLNVGVQKCLAAWEAETLLTIQYLPDGTNGAAGLGVITNLTLSGGLEAVSTFAVDFQGSDISTVVGTGI